MSVSAYQGEKAVAPRVLIVDDDEMVQLVLSRALGDLGWHAVAATDGAAGIAAYKESSFDVVLLDLNMPKMDGFAVL